MTPAREESRGLEPKLSVILFVRNLASTIERAVRSVVEQDYQNFEVIALDGGSSDGTAQILERYRDRFAYWRSAPDGGPINAINEGISKADGDIVALLSGDDWFQPGAFAAVAKAFAECPALEVLSCAARIVELDSSGRVVRCVQHADPNLLKLELDKVVLLPLTHARFIRREVFRRIGKYDPLYPVSVDLDFLLRLCLARPKSAVIPTVVYTYLRHPGSNTLGSVAGRNTMLTDDIALARRYLSHHGLSPAERRALWGLHARASVNLSLACIRRAAMIEALKVLARALRYDHRLLFRLPRLGLNSLTRRTLILHQQVTYALKRRGAAEERPSDI